VSAAPADELDPGRELYDPTVQALDATEVAARADAGLRETWARAWELPFYAERYAAAGLSAGEMPPLHEIPRVTKADHRADEAAHPPFGRHRAVTLDHARRVGVSTGTTGTPTYILYGPRDLDAMVRVSMRNNWRLGLRSGDRFTHSWPQYLYPTSAHGGRPYLDLGILEIPVGPPFSPESAAEHLRVWEHLRPTGFMMTASQFQTYEKVGDDVGIDFAALLEGSLLVYLDLACQFDAPRRRIEEAYGVRLHNLSGASEIPAFSVNDSRYHRGFQAAGDHVVIEVVDPVTGKEVPHGERGHLVVSSFGLDACYLRYDLEDVVVRPAPDGPAADDPTGETGPRYFLVGRGADAVRVDGREALFPLDVQLALDDHGAPEFQLVPDADTSMLRVRVEHDGSGDIVGALLTERLGVRVDVEAVAPGTLPRAAFKPRRIAVS
jgi:phenylacetate-CoA ligase